MVHLAWLGREGLVQLGELLLARTHYARQRLCEIDGVSAFSEQPAIREIAVRLPCAVAAARARCIAAGVNPGVDVQALTRRSQDEGLLLVAITERRTRQDIDRLAQVLGAAVRECKAVRV
jgi:glycine dehydrogenase subunit 1